MDLETCLVLSKKPGLDTAQRYDRESEGHSWVECSLVLRLGTSGQKKSRQEPYLFSSKYYISATGGKPFQQNTEVL